MLIYINYTSCLYYLFHLESFNYSGLIFINISEEVIELTSQFKGPQVQFVIIL